MTKSRKKILFVVTESHIGGRQRYIYDIVTNLNPIAFDRVVAMGGDGAFFEKLATADIRTITVKGLTRRITLIGDMLAFLRLLGIIFKEEPDILHLNSTKTGILGSLAGRLYNVLNVLRTRSFESGVRIVFTAHGWAFTEERTPLSRFFIKLAQWLTVVLSHVTIAVSHDTKRHMAGAPFAEKRIRIVHNGIKRDLLRHKQVARKTLFPDGLPEGSENALWIGTIAELNRNKGVATAINALAHLKESDPDIPVQYVVIGQDRGELKHLKRLVKNFGLEGAVHFVGDHDDARSLLRAFDIFALTSVKEGFPYVILEAGVAGLPVLASSVGGTPEIITDMESGVLTQPHNSKEVARAFQYLAQNKKRRRELAAALLEKITAEFELEQMVHGTTRIYSPH